MKRSAIVFVLLVLAAFSVEAAKKSSGLLQNGDFKKSSKKITPWVFTKDAHGWAEVNVEKEGGIRVQTKAPSAPWYLRVQQEVDVKKGKAYKVSFEAKTDAPAKKVISVWVRQFNREDNSMYVASLKKNGLKLDSEWAAFEFEFTVTEVKKPGRLWSENELCFLLGGLDGHFYLRNVVLVEVK